MVQENQTQKTVLLEQKLNQLQLYLDNFKKETET